MKERIVRTFRRVYNRHSFIETDGLKLYVVDRAESEDGEVEIMDKEDDSIKAVCLENENNIEVFLMDLKKMHYPLQTSCIPNSVNVPFYLAKLIQRSGCCLSKQNMRQTWQELKKQKLIIPIGWLSKLKQQCNIFVPRALLTQKK